MFPQPYAALAISPLCRIYASQRIWETSVRPPDLGAGASHLTQHPSACSLGLHVSLGLVPVSLQGKFPDLSESASCIVSRPARAQAKPVSGQTWASGPTTQAAALGSKKPAEDNLLLRGLSWLSWSIPCVPPGEKVIKIVIQRTSSASVVSSRLQVNVT